MLYGRRITAYQQKGANVPPDPNTIPDPAQDPDADTPGDESEDTAADTQGNTGDWETRYRNLQSHTSQKIDQLQRQLEALTTQGDDDEAAGEDDSDEEEDEAPVRDRRAERLERESWALAEQVYGGDTIKAYEKAAVLFDKAQTPADYIAAFEAYHQARLGGGQKKAQRQAQDDSSQQPQVDPNRPDASPRNDNLNREAEEARARGDSRGFFLAQVRRLRGE